MDKPYDRLLKTFTDEAPRLLAQVLGVLPRDAKATLTMLRNETAPPVILPDCAALITPEMGAPFIFHAEFELQYRLPTPRRMARYGASLAWQYEREVESVLVILRRDGLPDVIPDVGEYSIGKTRITHRYRVVKIWELDPGPILETGDPRVLPWAALMASTPAQVQWIANEIIASGNRELLARLMILVSIRYDRKQLGEFTGGVQMGIVEAILEGSSLVQHIVDKAEEKAKTRGWQQGLEEGREEGREEGLEQGIEKGIQRGRAEEARRLLRTSLAAKFPGLESMPELDTIRDCEVMESLLVRHVIGSSDPESTALAIREAAATAQ